MAFLIEVILFLIILVFAWGGLRRGFLSQFFDLLGLIATFVIALRFYNFLATIFAGWGLSETVARPIGFLVLWGLLQIVFYSLFLFIFRFVPQSAKEARINRYLGLIPGAFKGLITIAIILLIFVVLPFSPVLKENLLSSPFSGFLIKSTTKIENQLENVFGALNTLTFLSPTKTEETTKLDFQTNNFTIDADSEQTMVNQVNVERTKIGLKPLKVDVLIRNVARAHSMDMARNGYFSHINLESKSPAERLLEAKVDFILAGENIALAPSGELAEIGFMNSPKHRDNILDADYGRIGIGIINLGSYGKMVTQNFAN